VPPPPRAKTHNWPPFGYQRYRAKILRPPPYDPLIHQHRPEYYPKPDFGPEDDPICGARDTKQGDADGVRDSQRPPNQLCLRPAGNGTNHPGFGPCSKHGGNTGAVRKGAALDAGRHFIERMKAEITMFGGDPATVTITPQEALMEEVRRSVAMVRYLQSQISTWNPAVGDMGALPTLTDETSLGSAAPTDAAEWLRLYREERAHMVRVSKMAIDAGVSMLMVRLAQEQGMLVASAVKRILDSLQLSPDQAALVPSVVPKILGEISQQSFPVNSPVLEGVVLR